MAIIVLNWNGWKNTIECLESLRWIIYPSYKSIAVDNGSTDDSIREVKHRITIHGGDFADASLETLTSARSYVSLKIIFSLAGWVVD